jgi:hypothetical protein
MGLKEFMSSIPVEERRQMIAKIANGAGVSESCIKHYINGTRNCPPKRAQRIESTLGGAVTAHEIVFGVAVDCERSRSSTSAA